MENLGNQSKKWTYKIKIQRRDLVLMPPAFIKRFWAKKSERRDSVRRLYDSFAVLVHLQSHVVHPSPGRERFKC